MKLPITASELHQGKVLDIDCEQETMTLFPSTQMPRAVLMSLPW